MLKSPIQAFNEEARRADLQPIAQAARPGLGRSVYDEPCKGGSSMRANNGAALTGLIECILV